jgi:translation initiation factor 2 gamma subunit (eIF-2gamma)
VTDDVLVTRGEFELLKQIVASNQARLEGIDQGGTKGVAVVQTQLIEVVKDLTELKAEVNARFDAHLKEHDQEALARSANRRWAIGTFIAALAIVVTLLLNITFRLRYG